MKIMICANALIGDSTTLSMTSKAFVAWQKSRVNALACAMRRGKELGAQKCFILGGLFGTGFIPKHLIEDAVGEIEAFEDPVAYYPFANETQLVDSGVVIPENLTVEPRAAAYFNVTLGDGFDAQVRREDDVQLVLNNNGGSETVKIGNIEPAGFGEPTSSGFLIIEADGPAVQTEWIEMAEHPFIEMVITLDNPSSMAEIVKIVGTTVKDTDRAAALRIVLRGSVPLDVHINTEQLEQSLQNHFFYVEIQDECTVGLDATGLDSDVSLLAEFVRLVSDDMTLSETEKTRVLRCGWNVLNGKELAE